MTVSAAPTTTLADFWCELVTGSLLGTDRRDPPEPPPGPLADLVDDAVRPSPSARMLEAVAACAVARRAGTRPRPPAARLVPPEPDGRPVVPPAASRRWWQVTALWPVLEDEWLDTVEARGWRLPADVLVGLLRRHRRDGQRRAQVVRMAGPVGAWLTDHLPELASTSTRARAPTDTANQSRDAALAVVPDHAPLLNAEPAAVVAAVAGGLADGTFGAPHKAVLVNFVARCRRDTLAPLADALRRVESPAVGLAHLLADLAATRHEMLLELADE